MRNNSPSVKMDAHRMQKRAQRTLKAAQGYQKRLHGSFQGPPGVPLGSLFGTLDALLESNLLIWMYYKNLFQKQMKYQNSCELWV